MQSLREFYKIEFSNKSNTPNSEYGMDSYELELKYKKTGSYFTRWIDEID